MDNRIIFACDYEGTYHRLPGHPEATEVDAVRKFRREGNLFGIVMEIDVFEAWAGHGEYEAEFDFVVCSTGGGVISRMPVGSPDGILGRLPCDVTANTYYLTELYELFVSVGAKYIGVDAPGFRGGDSEGKRFIREFDPALGMGCTAHFWGGGGNYCHGPVNKDALVFLAPFSQCRARFKNSITAEGVAAECNRRYMGRLRAYADGNDVVVIPECTNKAAGVMRYADFAGISYDNIWAYGNGTEDACMLSRFKGIATADAHPAAAAAAKYTAATVAEAIELIKSKA